MADCSNTPTPESTANFDLDSRCFSEAMTSNEDYTTARASDGNVKKTYASALRDAGWVSAGEWSTNPTITEPNQYVFYNNQRFAPVNLPYTVDSATNPNPNTLVPGELREVSNYLDESWFNENNPKTSVLRADTVDLLKTGGELSLTLSVGQEWSVRERKGYVFKIENTGSGNGFDSIDVGNGLFANLQPVPFIDSYAFGCNGTDDTQPFNRALQYSAENNVAIVLINQPVLKTPYDASCYFRVPNKCTLKGMNDGNGGSVIQIHPTEAREFGMALNELTSLSDPAPANPADSVTLEGFCVKIADTGFDIDVAIPIVASQFHCKYDRLKATGSKRHAILISRVWYSTIGDLFAFDNKGSGITIGKHPDITGFTDGAVNGVSMGEITAHTSDTDQTWQEINQEKIGAGVSFWGTMFNLKIAMLKTEKNNGAGFQDSSNYGNWAINSHYTEANGSHGCYIANVNSAGKTWEYLNIQMQQDESMKIRNDNLTRGKLGIAFMIGGNTIDVSGVNGRYVKVDEKNCSYAARQALAPLIVDYDVIHQVEGNLNTYTNVLKFIGNTASDVPFNYQIVFTPTVTTTSTDTFGSNLYIDGAPIGTTTFAGPFTEYEMVVIKSFSGNEGVFYENKQTKSYNEDCPGFWQVRVKRF